MAGRTSPKIEQIELKRLRLRDGDILVIREPANAPEDFRETTLKKLGNVLRATNVLVYFANSLSDVKALSPKQLERIVSDDS